MELAIAFSTSSLILRSRKSISNIKRYHHTLGYAPLSLYSSPKHSCILAKVQSLNQLGDARDVKNYVSGLATKLWEISPKSLKEFPWKKAEGLVAQRLWSLGQTTLKWAVITLCIASFLSDIIFSIKRNQELVIPFGLFIGIALHDYLKETSKEVFGVIKDVDLHRNLFGISFFFLFVKFLSLSLSTKGRVFLSHVGNGGLMRALWLARKFQEVTEKESNGDLEYDLVADKN